MSVRISVSRHASLGLTERCRNAREFIASVGAGSASRLAEHLRDCPACRKVAIDALAALVSEGDPLRPSGRTVKEARRILDRLGLLDAPVFAIHSRGGAIVKLQGPGFELRKTTLATARWKGPFYSLTLLVETAGDRFIVRLQSSGCEVAVAALKGADGKPARPPRQMRAQVAWTGLEAGRYGITVAGVEGCQECRLKLIASG